jgi:hypothetical protein
MTSHTGKSHGRDPGQTTTDLNTAAVLQLPTSGLGGVYATPPSPPWSLSGMLASSLCVATVVLAATVVLVIIEEVHGAPVVSSTTMSLLTAASATTWIAVVLIASRDRQVRSILALRGSIETVQSRQIEVYRRQDHLAQRISKLDNRGAELLDMMLAIAVDVAAIRAEMTDVLGVADADAELSVRKSVVNGNQPQASLYVVPQRGQG